MGRRIISFSVFHIISVSLRDVAVEGTYREYSKKNAYSVIFTYRRHNEENL